LDTLNFVLEGDKYTRTLDIVSWKNVLALSNGYYEKVNKDALPYKNFIELEDKFLNLAVLTVSERIIGLWCSRENGFEDMIQTILILSTHDSHDIKKPISNDYSFKFNF
jgi:hypothetical protein